MIQSRASFVAAALVGVLLFTWTIINFLKNKSYKPLINNIYYLLPMILAIILNQTFVSSKGADALSRASTISISTNDGSVNQRLRYYEDVLTHISSNPIFGVGIGNWKLTSIDYDKADITGYIVPYHAHSDFIQLGAELELLDLYLFGGIFKWCFFCIYFIV